MSNQPEGHLSHSDELDPITRQTLAQMVAAQPAAGDVMHAVERARRLLMAPRDSSAGGGDETQTVLQRPETERLAGGSHWRPARRHVMSVVAASFALFALWIGSASDAWAQIALDFQEAGSAVDSTGTGLSDAVNDEPKGVGPMRRFILILHIVSLLAGLFAMLGSWLLSIAVWISPKRTVEQGRGLVGLEYRTIWLGCVAYGIGILFGCLFSYATWGTVWRWHPKEVFGLLTLGIGCLWCTQLASSSRQQSDDTRGLNWRFAIPSIAFWMIMLIYAMSGTYGAELHSYSAPTFLPTAISVLFGTQVGVCSLWHAAVSRRSATT